MSNLNAFSEQTLAVLDEGLELVDWNWEHTSLKFKTEILT